MKGDKGSDFNVNFRNFETDDFQYDGESGAVYLNTYQSKTAIDDKSAIRINLGAGEVVIQSTKSYKLNFKSPTQTICMTAP
jgi:hypothetical protein